MPYRFQRHETFDEGFSRIGLRELDRVHADLTAKTVGPTAIHDARKAFKRIRALLCLVRPALPPKVYAKENARYRKIGRRLSASRDLHVMRETILKLESWQRIETRGSLTRLRKQVWHAGHDETIIASEARNKVIDDLEVARKKWRSIVLSGDGFELVGKGFKASYQSGLRAFAIAYADNRDQDFHEWRKYVQQHWRHMQLLHDAWPAYFSARMEAAKALSEIVGYDHDLCVLADFARRLDKSRLPPKHARIVLRLIEERQCQLRDIAHARGDRLYVESAKGLHDRVKTYWETSLRIAAAEHAASKGPGNPNPIGDADAL